MPVIAGDPGAARRPERLADDLLLFARTPAAELAPVRLAGVLGLTADLLAGDPVFGEVRVEVAGVDESRAGGPELLTIAFQNLLINAAQAMQGRGTISATVTAADERIQRVAVPTTRARDLGRGTSELFKPFFTTKARGTGLGLATAKRLVESLGHDRHRVPAGRRHDRHHRAATAGRSRAEAARTLSRAPWADPGVRSAPPRVLVPHRGLRFQPAVLDAVAQRRALDLQQFGGPRLVAVARLQRPGDQVRLEIAQPIVQRDRRRGALAGDARPAPARVRRLRLAPNRMLAATHPTRTVPHVQVWAIRSHAFSSSRTLPGQGTA